MMINLSKRRWVRRVTCMAAALLLLLVVFASYRDLFWQALLSAIDDYGPARLDEWQ